MKINPPPEQLLDVSIKMINLFQNRNVPSETISAASFVFNASTLLKGSI